MYVGRDRGMRDSISSSGRTSEERARVDNRWSRTMSKKADRYAPYGDALFARELGDIFTPKLAIIEGGEVNGKIEMSREESRTV